MFKRQEKKNKYDSAIYIIYRLFLEHMKPQMSKVWFVIFCMLLIAATTATQAWLIQPLLDEIFFKKDAKMLYIIPVAVIFNAVIKAVASFFQSSTMKVIGQKIVTDIQLRLYSHLIYADMRFLTEYPSGKLISRFTNDINAMRKTASETLTSMVMEFCTLIALVCIMLYQSFALTLLAFILLPLALMLVGKLSKRMRQIAKGMQEELGGFTVRLDETFQNIRIIKSYCREEYEVSRAKNVIKRVLGLYNKAAYVESAPSPIMEALAGIIIAFFILYDGMQVMNGNMTPGAFFSFVTALLMAYKPLKSLSQFHTSMQEGITASKRLFLMIDEEATIQDDHSQKITKFNSYNIEFKNVFFSYKTDTQKILDGLNIMIPEGKTVALVGSSGSGKTTILNLIQRFYDADYGDILIDDKDIKNIRLSSIRNAMALVSQEIALFDDTIRENIRYGRLDATEEEIIDAALAAAAHDFITNLPDGYDTHIGQHGVKVSGGQRQRIAIARAILKNAPILLLDEATSALDAISEKQVQMALEYLKKGRTTIVIAHRLSTIESADLIYVISDGKASESGNHNELLEKGGEYARLYEQYKII